MSSEDSNLENALIKTKVLLHKMGEKSLLTWVNSELNGYSNQDDIPTYRIVSTNIYGTATNGYTTRWENHPLPIYHLTKEEQEHLTILKFQESISGLEELSKSEKLVSIIPVEFCSRFNKGLAKGVYVESAYSHISNIDILQILTNIRSRLLNFLLELSDKLENMKGEINLKSESKKIKTEELFKHTIFGDNTTIIVGDKNTTNTTQLKNDIDALFETLKKYNISEKELTQLEKSIEKDTESGVKKYGKNVQDWLAKVSGKAIEKGTLDTMSGIGEAVTSFF